jgi:nitroreductase
LTLNENHIHEHIQNTAATRSLDTTSLEGFRSALMNNLLEMKPELARDWSKKQCYIALGQLLCACAQLGIDATPMEGFSPEGYDQVLGLKEQNLEAVLACPVGFRSETDSYQFKEKVRKSKENLFLTIH